MMRDSQQRSPNMKVILAVAAAGIIAMAAAGSRNISAACDVTVSDLRTRETDGPVGYTRWAWRAEVENGCDAKVGAYVEVTFYDEDGFEVSDNLSSAEVPARSSRTVTGRDSMPDGEAARVDSAVASLRWYRR